MIYIVQPPTARRNTISGGYRYNAEVGRRLEAARLGRTVDVHPDLLLDRLSELAERGPGNVLVIDSLYMALFKEPPEWLGELASLGTVRMLLHYLPSLNPKLDEAARRTLEESQRAWIGAVGGLVSPSNRIAEQVRAAGTAVRVAPPGIASCFRSVSPQIRKWVRGETLTVVSVGSLIPEKGQLQIAGALGELGQEVPPVRLVLVGDDQADLAYRDAVLAAAQQARRPFELVLAGCLEKHEVAVHLQRAHLYVSSSLFESFGMATAEAVATGVPLLSYKTGEVEQWLGDGLGGVLVEEGDEKEFKAQLLALLSDASALHELGGRNGRRQFSTWEDTFLKFVAACGKGDPDERGIGVTLYSQCRLPTELGTFDVEVYRCHEDESESILIGMGDLASGDPPFVRVHSECYTGEVLCSLKCDCKAQLHGAMESIAARGKGAVIYLRQEGRGIGLGNKIRAYAEQDNGADTVQANHIIGFPTDLRDFSAAASILRAKGVRQIEINTNNPQKIASLKAEGIGIDRVLPSVTRPNPHNFEYLQTKLESLGHAGLEQSLRQGDSSDDEKDPDS